CGAEAAQLDLVARPLEELRLARPLDLDDVQPGLEQLGHGEPSAQADPDESRLDQVGVREGSGAQREENAEGAGEPAWVHWGGGLRVSVQRGVREVYHERRSLAASALPDLDFRDCRLQRALVRRSRRWSVA